MGGTVIDCDELFAGARRAVAEGHFPACQVAVGAEGAVVATEAFGAADADSRFCVFSATKPVVAAAAWRLIGQGRLDIDAPVARYIDGFGSNGKEAVTVEQVFC